MVGMHIQNTGLNLRLNKYNGSKISKLWTKKIQLVLCISRVARQTTNLATLVVRWSFDVVRDTLLFTL